MSDSPATETPPTETTEQPPSDNAGSQPEFQSVDEAVAHWQKRIAGKDKVHAAEAQALREERDSLKERLTQLEKAQAEGKAASMSEADRWKQQFEEAEAKLRETTERFTLDNRKVKYPKAAEFLGEDGLKAFDDGRLAAIEVRLTEAPVTPPPVIDKNTPPRNPSEPPKQKSSAELKAELEKLAPGFRAELNIR